MEETYDILRHYYNEISDHELLGREGEIFLAMQIEQDEIEVWRIVLAQPSTFRLVLRNLEEQELSLPLLESLGRMLRARTATVRAAERARKNAIISSIAADLREQDRSRTNLAAVLAAIRSNPARNAAEKEWTKNVESAAATAARSRQRFVEANLRFVVSMSRRFAGRGVPAEDLIQEGNIGLMKAVDRFDPRKGYRFSTYASWWIRHAMGRSVANISQTIRRPVHVYEAHKKVTRTQRELFLKLAREPTDEEVAEHCDLTAERVTAIQTLALGATVSLDAPIGEDDTTHLELLVDAVNDEDSILETVLLRDEIANMDALLKTLSPVQTDVLTKRFGLGGGVPKSLRSIGEEYGLSRERIRQIQCGALALLRTALERQERFGLHHAAAS